MTGRMTVGEHTGTVLAENRKLRSEVARLTANLVLRTQQRDEHMMQLCHEATLDVETTESEEAEDRWGLRVARDLYPEETTK